MQTTMYIIYKSQNKMCLCNTMPLPEPSGSTGSRSRSQGSYSWCHLQVLDPKKMHNKIIIWINVPFYRSEVTDNLSVFFCEKTNMVHVSSLTDRWTDLKKTICLWSFDSGALKYKGWSRINQTAFKYENITINNVEIFLLPDNSIK